ITALLRSAPLPPDEAGIRALEERRLELIRQAQQAIIMEEASLLSEDLKVELGLVCPEPAPSQNEIRVAAISAVTESGLAPVVRDYLVERLKEEDPLDRFVRNFKRLHKQDSGKLLQTVGRASRILGQILDDIADQRHIKSPHITWITRLMRIFWG